MRTAFRYCERCGRGAECRRVHMRRDRLADGRPWQGTLWQCQQCSLAELQDALGEDGLVLALDSPDAVPAMHEAIARAVGGLDAGEGREVA